MKDWSPECVRIPTGPPADWGIEEVIQYITATDPALKAYAELFRTHVMSHVAFAIPQFVYRLSFSRKSMVELFNC